MPAAEGPVAEGPVADARGSERVVVAPDLDATVVLVRHGESQYIVEGRFQGRADSPLSELGRRQAALVAERLARPHASPALPVPSGEPLEIVHSPLARAAETARTIGEAIERERVEAGGTAVRPEDGLTEIGQGSWEGLHRAEIEARDGGRLAAWRRTPVEAWAPGGESLAEARSRVAPALGRLLARLGDASTGPVPIADAVAGYGSDPPARRPWSIVVGHDGVFKVVLLSLFDLPLERFWMWSFELASVSVVDIRAGRVLVRALNLDAHLAPLLDERAQVMTEQRSEAGAL
jgi:probable phosphoglycerate mutase